MARYRLLDVFGGGEIECEPSPARGCVRWVDEALETRLIPLWMLTPVEPPLPEEPPIGAYRVGGVLCMRVSSEPGKCWVYQTKDELFSEETFERLCSDFGTDIVHLVPYPTIKPVELPWKRKFELGTLMVSRSTAANRDVYVDGLYGHITADEARDMAAALVTAANAADKEQS